MRSGLRVGDHDTLYPDSAAARNEEELAEWAERLRRLEAKCETVCVVSNNNSGGDAADNAKRMMALLGQVPPRGTFDTGESAEQLDLFGDPGEW